MRYALLTSLVIGLLPMLAQAGDRDHGRDRGNDGRWSVSFGMGSRDSGYCGTSDYFNTQFRYSSGYDRGYRDHDRYDSGISYRPQRYTYRESYYPPPVVYSQAPVYYPAPVYCPPPVVYSPPPVYCPPQVYYPAPVYQPSYPSGGYSYYSSTYYYGR